MSKNKSPDFIGVWKINSSLCEEIINFYNEHKDSHRQGISGDKIDLDKKKSTDLTVHPKDLKIPGHECFNEYFNELNKCYQSYKEEWAILNECFQEVDVGSFNIQKYEIGGHFSKIHSERMSLHNLHRLFAFMTYLNDDFEGGHTFFSHYDLSIKPERGKTLIWPAEWTHAHRGEEIKTNSKFIITGWLNIPLPKNY
jgi:hypothetical protein